MATFVLVHGSMHGGWYWRRVTPLLRAAGQEVYTPTLTGLGERVHLAHPDIDLDTHIRDVLGVLEYEDLRDVVLVGHSYGTVVITGVADRLPGRIAHLVHLDGTVAGDGHAVLDFFPPDGRAARRARVEADGEGWRLPPPADPAVWGITAADDAAWVRARVAPQPFRTFTQPLRLTNPAGFSGPTTFIACVGAAPARLRRTLAKAPLGRSRLVRRRPAPARRRRERRGERDGALAAIESGGATAGRSPGDPPRLREQGETAETVQARPGWSEVSAVRQGRVVVVDPDLTSRAGPRVVEALETLARALHPDALDRAARP